MGGSRGGGGGSGAAKGAPGGGAAVPPAPASDQVWDLGIPDAAKTWNEQQFGDFVRDHVIQRFIDREAREVFKEMGLPLRAMRVLQTEVRDLFTAWGTYSWRDGKLTVDLAHAQLLRETLRTKYSDIRREPTARQGMGRYYELVALEQALTLPGRVLSRSEQATLARIRAEKASLAGTDRRAADAQMRVQRTADVFKTILHEAIHALRPGVLYSSRAQKGIEEAITETLAIAASRRVLQKRGANAKMVDRVATHGAYPGERLVLRDIARQLGLDPVVLATRLRRSKNALGMLRRMAGPRRSAEFERSFEQLP